MSLIPLGETARFINGAAFKPSDWSNEGLPIIRIQNLTGSGETFNYTTRQVKNELVIEPGDLLVSWSATLDVYRWDGPKGLLNQHIFKVLPKPGIDPDYLFYAIKSVLAELSAKTHGSTMKHVVRGDFESTLVRVPSLPEQRRLVDILSRTEGLIRLHKDALAKAIEIIPALFIDMFGDPAINPMGWQRHSFNELISSIDSGQSPKCHDRLIQEGEWGVLKLSAVTLCDYNEGEHKTLPISIEPDSTLEVQRGDVLLSRKNTYELVGATAYVWSTQGRMLLPDLIFRPNIADPDRLHPIYLWVLLTMPSKRQQLRKLASGSAGSMPNISKARLNTLEIEVPPYTAQMEFAGIIEDIHSIRTQTTAALAAAQATFQSLLHRAFTGGIRP